MDRIHKLHRDYWRIEADLCSERDALYPVGTEVVIGCLGMTATVTKGSLYADQVMTNMGHVAWRNLKKVPTSP